MVTDLWLEEHRPMPNQPHSKDMHSDLRKARSRFGVLPKLATLGKFTLGGAATWAAIEYGPDAFERLFLPAAGSGTPSTDYHACGVQFFEHGESVSVRGSGTEEEARAYMPVTGKVIAFGNPNLSPAHPSACSTGGDIERFHFGTPILPGLIDGWDFVEDGPWPAGGNRVAPPDEDQIPEGATVEPGGLRPLQYWDAAPHPQFGWASGAPGGALVSGITVDLNCISPSSGSGSTKKDKLDFLAVVPEWANFYFHQHSNNYFPHAYGPTSISACGSSTTFPEHRTAVHHGHRLVEGETKVTDQPEPGDDVISGPTTWPGELDPNDEQAALDRIEDILDRMPDLEEFIRCTWNPELCQEGDPYEPVDFTMPSLRGVPTGVAVHQLESLGFETDVEELTWPEVDITLPEETVVEHNPGEGAVVTTGIGAVVLLAVNPSILDFPVIMPEPNPGETAEEFKQRLISEGWLEEDITIMEVPESQINPEVGPNEVASVQPAPGTRTAPETFPEVTIRMNPPTAHPPGAWAPPGISGPNFGPLQGLSIACDKFPFGLFCWIYEYFGGWSGGECDFDFNIPTSQGDIPVNVCVADPAVQVFRPIILVISMLVSGWMIAGAAMGGGAQKPPE